MQRCEKVEIVGLGGPGGEQALGMGGAVAAFRAVAVALFAQHLAGGPRQHRAERVVAGLARSARHVERAPQQLEVASLALVGFMPSSFSYSG